MSCPHKWISNSGDGGTPRFHYKWGSRVMKVRCALCTIFAWIGLTEWRNGDTDIQVQP